MVVRWEPYLIFLLDSFLIFPKTFVDFHESVEGFQSDEEVVLWLDKDIDKLKYASLVVKKTRSSPHLLKHFATILDFGLLLLEVANEKKVKISGLEVVYIRDLWENSSCFPSLRKV